MTGSDHYREAERLLEESMSPVTIDPDRRGRIISRAQVHATLALAAATALNVPHPEGGMENDDSLAWFKAASAARKR